MKRTKLSTVKHSETENEEPFLTLLAQTLKQEKISALGFRKPTCQFPIRHRNAHYLLLSGSPTIPGLQCCPRINIYPRAHLLRF